MAVAPWVVPDELWELVAPLLPRRERRFRYPGRKRFPDREALSGILFVLHTGIAWQRLRAAGEIEWSRAVVDSSQIQAKKGAPKRARARSTGAVRAQSTTS